MTFKEFAESLNTEQREFMIKLLEGLSRDITGEVKKLKETK